MKPKIYISGPITHNPHYMRDFRQCQDFLIREGKYDPINPASLIHEMIKSGRIPPEMSNEDYYFRLAINFMITWGCKDIIMLPKFWKSRAIIELKLAFDMDYTVHLFQKGKRVLA